MIKMLLYYIFFNKILDTLWNPLLELVVKLPFVPLPWGS